MSDPSPAIAPPWEQAVDALLAAARDSLTDDRSPPPLLLAHAGDEPVATVVLRPFGSGGLVDVLVEVLALLLPLGTDRVALAVPGRAWSIADPVPPVTATHDLRQPVLMVTAADAHTGPCQLTTQLYPYGADGVDEPVSTDEHPDAPALAALAVLLDTRADLQHTAPDLRLAAQFARVLLRGNEVVLTEDAARALEQATTA